MVAIVSEASKLSLPINPFVVSSSPPNTISVTFEPNSLSLALTHSDSSISLYPSLSPLSVSSLPPPQTLISPPSSASTFLLLNSNSTSRVIFVVAGPHKSGAQLLIRFYLLQTTNKSYLKPSLVSCSQKGLQFNHNLGGVLMDVHHGASVKLSGSVNFFAMYSFTRSKIWVFGVRLMDGDVGLKLMRCAVIECCKPVWSMCMSFGFFIFGEENGVRVLSLKSLVKGKSKRVKNGIVGDGVVDGSGKEIDKHSTTSVKQKSVKYRQDSGEGGASFVALENTKSTQLPTMSLKAISVQALSSKRFLVLDSAGDLHMLHLLNSIAGASISAHVKQLPHFMNVQKLAILPDVSSRMLTIWIADGYHSVHILAASEMDAAAHENAGNEIEEKPMDISVAGAIFTGEKIQDIAPLSSNGVLVLGQGNLYAYANS